MEKAPLDRDTAERVLHEIRAAQLQKVLANDIYANYTLLPEGTEPGTKVLPFAVTLARSSLASFHFLLFSLSICNYNL